MATVYNKNGIPFDIDALATDVNGKMDKDGVNATCPVVISRTPNEQGGVVEIWSDGYCVQTGIVATATADITYTVNLSQSYKDASYIITLTENNSSNNAGIVNIHSNIAVNSFEIRLSHKYNSAGTPINTHYRTEGYIR
jgi:hypothetical protein